LDHLAPKFIQVNCSAAIDWSIDPTGHQYYRNNNQVRQDVLAVLSLQEADQIQHRTTIGDRRQTYRLG
jgi:hypothetical protein